jgi:hypothetical protein
MLFGLHHQQPVLQFVEALVHEHRTLVQPKGCTIVYYMVTAAVSNELDYCGTEH